MSPNPNKSFVTPIVLGYVVFFVLLLYSIVFYLERTCYADIAFQTFFIINTKSVFYQLDRFGALFIQLFPLAAVCLKLPLKYVLLSYSVTLVLQNLFFFWLLHRVLKQKEVALVLVLFNVLLVSETFYWATNEVKQGFSFSILFAGVLRAWPTEQFKGWKKGGVALLYLAILVISLYLHPLVAFAIAFILGYHAIYSGRFSESVLVSAVMVITVLLAKYFLLSATYYDAEQFSLRDNFIHYFPNYFALPSFRNFLSCCLHDWYLYCVIVLAVLLFYILKRQWLKLGWLLLFSFAYLLLVNVTHPNSEKAFIECYYQALAVFILFPFVLDVLAITNIRYVVLILAVICGLRLNFIYHAHKKYTARLNMVERTLAAHAGKFAIRLEDYPVQHGLMTWGIPYESALLSSLVSPDSCRSFVVKQDVTTIGSDENSIYTVFRREDYTTLNTDYFRPALGQYQILTREEVSDTHLP